MNESSFAGSIIRIPEEVLTSSMPGAKSCFNITEPHRRIYRWLQINIGLKPLFQYIMNQAFQHQYALRSQCQTAHHKRHPSVLFWIDLLA